MEKLFVLMIIFSIVDGKFIFLVYRLVDLLLSKGTKS